MPQLAAAGVESQIIQKKTGWKIIWGPVSAKDIPGFIQNRLEKTPQMREVDFSWVQRIEMAVAWAFPISVISVLLMIPFWRGAVVPVTLLVWGLSFFIFISFPLYSQWLGTEDRKRGLICFDFGRGGFQLIMWCLLFIGIISYSFLLQDLTWGSVGRWSLISLIIILLLSIDLMGSTPVYKSGLHEDRLLKIILDRDRCRGAGHCEQVCPRNCYEVDKKRRIAGIPRAKQCVQCGSCIVQCPFDALYFKSPKGEIMTPETIRRFKLNLIGKRLVKVEGQARAERRINHEETEE